MTAVLLRGGIVDSPAHPFAAALLVMDDTVVWVGSERGAAAHADVADQIVDLDGALVTPAFVDAHVHVTETGLATDGVDLAGARTLTECLDRIAAHARSRIGGPIFGFGWDESGWPERRAPSLAEVDRAVGGEVAYLARVDVHSAVISSALIDRLPEIVTAEGYADGVVQRQAHRQARRASLGGLTVGQRRDLQRRVLQRAAALGIGQVHEIGGPDLSGEQDIRTLIELAATEALPEVVAYWAEVGPRGVRRAIERGARGAAGDLSLDGSIGSRTARLLAPYADTPQHRGYLYLDQAEAAEHVIACTRAGIQAGFHCIGDEAVRIAVRAVARAAEVCGLADVLAGRHRLEHVEMLAPELIPELARLGVVASVQPVFDELWGGLDGLYATRLGPSRTSGMNPFAAMVRAGVTLALGSDSPVTPLGGWDAVRAAVHHRTEDHRLSVRAAFTAATRGGWRAADVDDAGLLTPGAPACYTVWDVPGDSLVRAADEGNLARSSARRPAGHGLPDLSRGSPTPRCRRTVVRGRVVFEAQ